MNIRVSGSTTLFQRHSPGHTPMKAWIPTQESMNKVQCDYRRDTLYPRSTENMPLLNTQPLSQPFDIVHKIPCSIFFHTSSSTRSRQPYDFKSRSVEKAYGVDFPAPRWSKRIIYTSELVLGEIVNSQCRLSNLVFVRVEESTITRVGPSSRATCFMCSDPLENMSE